MFGTGKSTFLKKCLNKQFIAQIVPGDNPYNLVPNNLKQISSTFVYYRPSYLGINSMVCILTEIYRTFSPNEKFGDVKFLNF